MQNINKQVNIGEKYMGVPGTILTTFLFEIISK